MSLSAARDARNAAQAELKAGRNPALSKRLRKATAHDPNYYFEPIALEWFEKEKRRWREQHTKDVINSLTKEVFPYLGKADIREITPPMVLSVLRRIEARPAIETAHRVRQRISAVFVYAIASGLAENDPAAIVQKALSPIIKSQQPALTDLADVRDILRDVAATPASPVTKLALYLLALTAVRPGEIRAAIWSEFNLHTERPFWLIPAERMKAGKPHVVPLSPQAVAVIEETRTLTGKYMYLFPNQRFSNRPMSENALGYLLNRAGYHAQHVPHGWRAAFSSIMNEHYPADRSVIDLMLAHGPGGGSAMRVSSSESAYNRAEHITRRHELAALWADLLMQDVPAPAELLSGPRR